MKTRILYFFILLMTVAVSLPAAAKDKPTAAERRQWMQEMQNYKKEYIVKALRLTDAQKAKFMPLYEAMDKELRAVDSEARKLERAVVKKGSSAVDADYRNAADAMFNVRIKQGQIEAKYYKQFKTFLSAQQLYELKRAEDRFAREMMKRHREKNKEKRK